MEHHWVGIGFATSQEVDRINILQATFLAMRRAIEQLKSITESSFSSDFNLQKDGHIIVDGNQRIPLLTDYAQTTLIKGDQLVAEISAASIVAKVSRDRYVDELDAKYPEYEFRKHKGYGTLLHKQKIEELGPCPEHRITFKGVREFVSTEQKQSYQGTVG
jgi:ribonuclease HII